MHVYSQLFAVLAGGEGLIFDGAAVFSSSGFF
jgi:hypothetical protein